MYVMYILRCCNPPFQRKKFQRTNYIHKWESQRCGVTLPEQRSATAEVCSYGHSVLYSCVGFFFVYEFNPSITYLMSPC